MGRLLQYQALAEPLFTGGGAEIITADKWHPAITQPVRAVVFSLAALFAVTVLGDVPRVAAVDGWHPAIEQPQCRAGRQYLYQSGAADPLPRVATVDGWHSAI